jgi:hypothetical protein
MPALTVGPKIKDSSLHRVLVQYILMDVFYALGRVFWITLSPQNIYTIEQIL